MTSLHPTSIHMIGIGGTGLSAIARWLLESGYQVSGSDRQLTPLAQGLQAAGAHVFIGHRAENVQGASLVIRSSAIPEDNVEVVAAHAAGIPVLKRADFLGQVMEERIGIAVAGTHGKTTTTAMIAWLLTALDKDPSFIIGGVSANLGTNARAGLGPYFVIEADEYDRMFLGLKPSLAVITNIEHDHPDLYPTSEDFYQAFVAFTKRIQPGGYLVICKDDPGAARLFQEIQERAWEVQAGGLVSEGDLRFNLSTYGLEADGLSLSASDVVPNALGGFSFNLMSAGVKYGKVRLQVPGMHNVLNALATLAVAGCIGLPIDQSVRAMEEYQGTGRRFEVRGNVAGIVIIDDYGHHPTEIRATLAAARVRYPSRRLWAVWQPHTYSRTRTLFDGFANAFTDADRVVVTEIYASREMPPAEGFSARQVAEVMNHPDVIFIHDLSQASEWLLEHLSPGDVLLVFSAGDADQISSQVLNSLIERNGTHV